MALVTNPVRDLPRAVASRWNERAVVTQYDMYASPQARISRWHLRYAEVERLLRGDLPMKNPDGTVAAQAKMIVQNLAHGAVRDLVRIVAEDRPALRTIPLSRSDADIDQASVWSSIGHTYWRSDRCELKVPKLVADLAKGGAAFLLCYVEPTYEGEQFLGYAKNYPCHRRLKIPGAYPTWDEETLIDFLYVEQVKRRTVAARYPSLRLRYDPADSADMPVIDFWTPTETYKIVLLQAGSDGSYSSGLWQTVAYDKHDLGRVPIAWHMSPPVSTDNFFEGEYDQMSGTMEALNTIVWLVIDNAIRQVYKTPIVEGEVDMSKYGPDGEIRIPDPGAGKISYLETQAVDPSLLGLQQTLVTFARGTGAFPAAREGDVRQCLAPDTRVLTNDLHWVAVGELKVGDDIVAFDEFSGGQGKPRYYRAAQVTETGRVRLPSYRVTLSDGTVFVASAAHRWLTRTGSRQTEWRTTEWLARRTKASNRQRRPALVKALEPWFEPLTTWSAGYLAGMFDGEGSLSKPRSPRAPLMLGMAQRDNEALRRTEVALAECGYAAQRYTYPPRSTSFGGSNGAVSQVQVRGGREEIMRFLGEVRPPRLLAKWKALGGADCIGSMEQHNVGIVDITYIGEQEVVSLGTTTQTLIAEGFAHHNSIASAAFIAASQGEKASQGRAMERGLADIRSQQTEIDYLLDRKYFPNEKKRLYFPVGSKAWYTPKIDVPEDCFVDAIYSLGGIDPLSARVSNIQLVGARLKPRQQAIEEDPLTLNAHDAMQQILKEQTMDIVFQRALADPNFDYTLFASLIAEGKPELDAIKAVRASMMAAQAQAQPQTQMPPGAPGQLAQGQLEKGAIPGQTPAQGPLPQPAFAVNPNINVFAGRNSP